MRRSDATLSRATDLQGRADLPGDELFLADAVLFALGVLSAGHGDHRFEDLAALKNDLSGLDGVSRLVLLDNKGLPL